MLIGLTGLATSGKSEVARVLMGSFGFERVKFADPLKNMLRTMLRDVGHSDRDVERYLEGDLKETVVDGIGVTARRLMVTLGTEWGRDLVAADLWTRLWSAKAERFQFVMADDVRFPNEFDIIRRSGLLWRVERPGVVASDHPSETFIAGAEVHRVIRNDGTLADLHEHVTTLARIHGLVPHA